MMTIEFVQNYSGRRLDVYEPQPPLEDEPNPDEDQVPDPENLSYEIDRDSWMALDIPRPNGWLVGEWVDRPVRFIDGKDVGETIAWVRAPQGYPVPIRLAQIGAAAMCVIDGECHRVFHVVEKVVSMVQDPFPWQEIERFATALQANGYRLLPAQLPDGRPSYDFEKMRKPTQNRTNDEMRVLEEAAIAQDANVPTVVDGLLEPHLGGFDPASSPVFGVIKTHRRNYLHPQGIQLLYQLAVGQRTPMFTLPEQPQNNDIQRTARRIPVVSWFLRLAGESGATPNWGVVRIEVAKKWFESRGHGVDFVNHLSRAIYDYRCRECSYDRAAVSLHPIVRAEESLSALFSSMGSLTNRFYRLTGL
jgi:hypothetical protein